MTARIFFLALCLKHFCKNVLLADSSKYNISSLAFLCYLQIKEATSGIINKKLEWMTHLQQTFPSKTTSIRNQPECSPLATNCSHSLKCFLWSSVPIHMMVASVTIPLLTSITAFYTEYILRSKAKNLEVSCSNLISTN